MTSYFYILGTILFTVYGQIIIKWRVTKFGTVPLDFAGKLVYLLGIVLDPYIISALVAAFIASLCWMLAMVKLDLSYAYPFISSSFVLVMLFSSLIFKEPLTVNKVLGMIFITAGIIISSRSL